ncbi:MAG: tetratricopeptide repeat protein [Planctomycetes bacterium]|nr:tetratricopeptide repeat protein [Planctomycetota bacterium]
MSKRDHQDASASAPRAAHRLRPWAALSVALVAFAVFIPSITHPFLVWDDAANFVENPSYRGLGPQQIAWMFTTFHEGPYQPLSWVTLGFDYVLWGMNPTGYHLTNIVIHAIASALLYLLVVQLLEAGGSRRSAREVQFFGLAVSLVWAVHPLRVEAVSWVTERREVLCGALSFAVLLVALRGGRWWSITLLALCALLAKGTAVVLAPLLILLDLYCSRETEARALFGLALRSARRHALVIVLAFVFSAVALLGQGASSAIISTESHGLFDRLRIFSNALGLYVAKTVWPTGLAPMYEMPLDRNTLTLPALLSIAGLIMFLALAWRLRSRCGHLWTLGVAYLVMLLPVGGIVQVGGQIAADRYSYQPGAVIVIALVACIGLIGGQALSTTARWVLLGVICGWLTWRNVVLQAVWGDSAALWKHELTVYPDSPIAHLHLGFLQADGSVSGGDVLTAEQHFRAAVARAPSFVTAWCALGDEYTRQGRFAEALKAHEAALAVTPSHHSALVGRANALWALERNDEAITALRLLVSNAPQDFRSHLLLARALNAVGELQGARNAYEQAIAIAPHVLRPSTEFAWMLATHPANSARDGARALALAEAAAQRFGAHEQLVVQARTAALAELGRFDEAIAILDGVRAALPPAEARDLDPLIEQFRRHEPLRVPPRYP